MTYYTYKTFALFASIAFTVGLYILIGSALRQYAATLHSRRPIGESFTTRLFRRTRPFKLNYFCYTADSMLKDAHNLLSCPNSQHEARASLPIIADLRKEGEHLIAKQLFIHRCFLPIQEKKLEYLHKKLQNIESTIKSLPRSSLTIEDVLEGRFDFDKTSPQEVLHV